MRSQRRSQSVPQSAPVSTLPDPTQSSACPAHSLDQSPPNHSQSPRPLPAAQTTLSRPDHSQPPRPLSATQTTLSRPDHSQPSRPLPAVQITPSPPDHPQPCPDHTSQSQSLPEQHRQRVAVRNRQSVDVQSVDVGVFSPVRLLERSPDSWNKVPVTELSGRGTARAR